MVSHSPGPPVMYPGPSPVPRHMVAAHNGGMPAYGQAVWMSTMAGPAPPPSAGMVRSPYAPQLMPYPSPGAMPMYPGPVPMQNPQQQNGVQGRPPSMMMSPVMQPAMSPMYGSPVLVHTAPVGQGYPMPNQTNRPPMRSPYEQNPPERHPHAPFPHAPASAERLRSDPSELRASAVVNFLYLARRICILHLFCLLFLVSSSNYTHWERIPDSGRTLLACSLRDISKAGTRRTQAARYTIHWISTLHSQLDSIARGLVEVVEGDDLEARLADHTRDTPLSSCTL